MDRATQKTEPMRLTVYVFKTNLHELIDTRKRRFPLSYEVDEDRLSRWACSRPNSVVLGSARIQLAFPRGSQRSRSRFGNQPLYIRIFYTLLHISAEKEEKSDNFIDENNLHNAELNDSKRLHCR